MKPYHHIDVSIDPTENTSYEYRTVSNLISTLSFNPEKSYFAYLSSGVFLNNVTNILDDTVVYLKYRNLATDDFTTEAVSLPKGRYNISDINLYLIKIQEERSLFNTQDASDVYGRVPLEVGINESLIKAVFRSTIIDIAADPTEGTDAFYAEAYIIFKADQIKGSFEYLVGYPNLAADLELPIGYTSPTCQVNTEPRYNNFFVNVSFIPHNITLDGTDVANIYSGPMASLEYGTFTGLPLNSIKRYVNVKPKTLSSFKIDVRNEFNEYITGENKVFFSIDIVEA